MALAGIGGLGGGGFNFGANQLANRLGNIAGLNQSTGSPCILVSNLDEEVSVLPASLPD